MLTRVDRIQIVVADRAATVAAQQHLLGAELIRADRVRCLDAQRTVLRVGSSEIEVLEPDAAGVTADFLAHSGGGLFAAGFATTQLSALRAHLKEQRVRFSEEGGQLFINAADHGAPGLRAVVSADTRLKPAGLLRCVYEVTLLVPDFAAVVASTAALFGLDTRHFFPIRSAEFGYQGALTLFDPAHLDRVEIITPDDPAKTMGRFFAKRGPALYMCYAESDNLLALRSRLQEHAPNDWTGPRENGGANIDNLFIHPKALGGFMMGVSRTTFGWTWSGHPERVRPPS